MKPKVAIVKCADYDEQNIDRAVGEAVRLVGGWERYVKPGQKVLIKPNLLENLPPEAAVTTHPSVVAAVVRAVVKMGAQALVGDAPGNALSNIAALLETTGIRKAAEENGGKVVFLQKEGVVDIRSSYPRLPSFKVSRLALEADVIINLPKLKTHNLTLYTGAVKNMFGIVPGFQKAQFHAHAVRPAELAELLVDVFQSAKPALNIMDAVIGIEGKGPGADGTPRTFGAIAASSDAVALDAVFSHLIGFDPQQIETTKVANRRGLGEADLSKIEIIGEIARQTDWKKPHDFYQLSARLPALSAG